MRLPEWDLNRRLWRSSRPRFLRDRSDVLDGLTEREKLNAVEGEVMLKTWERDHELR